MPLHFVDVHGFEGNISDEFDLCYDGPTAIASSVEPLIDEIEAEVESTEAGLESLLIDLGEESGLSEVRRVEDAADDD